MKRRCSSLVLNAKVRTGSRALTVTQVLFGRCGPEVERAECPLPYCKPKGSRVRVQASRQTARDHGLWAYSSLRPAYRRFGGVSRVTYRREAAFLIRRSVCTTRRPFGAESSCSMHAASRQLCADRVTSPFVFCAGLHVMRQQKMFTSPPPPMACSIQATFLPRPACTVRVVNQAERWS